MRIDPLAPNRATQATPARTEERPQPCYLPPAPLFDILYEQLEYLTEHVSHTCTPGCPDCVRLIQVSNWLLLPFRHAKQGKKIQRRFL
jgi:hypothetical protein